MLNFHHSAVVIMESLLYRAGAIGMAGTAMAIPVSQAAPAFFKCTGQKVGVVGGVVVL